MSLREGTIIKHPGKPEWGAGIVLSSTNDKVKVLFPRVGEKQLMLAYAPLVEAEFDEEEARRWQQLAQPSRKFRNLNELVDTFLHYFPAGFEDDRNVYRERKNKEKGRDLFIELLNKESYNELLVKEDYDEIATRIHNVITETEFRMLAVQELIQLNDALRPTENKRLISLALFDSLYQAISEGESFKIYADCLERLELAKWTMQTCVHFFAFPDKHLFLKPSVSKEVAEVCAFDLNYNARPNWMTYHTYLDFGRFLANELANYGKHLKPKDMLDVYTFIWVTGGGY